MNSTRIITHNGTFHADDVFAVSILSLVYPTFEVVRTRDVDIIATGDIVLDVGRQYDPLTHRYDHHQEGAAGVRENGIPYAACGLIWKHFAHKLSDNPEVIAEVEKNLIEPIDAGDNGVLISESKFKDRVEYSLGSLVHAFNKTWKEEQNDDAMFLELVQFARKIVEREIKRATDKIDARSQVENAYQQATDKRIVFLDKPYPWGSVIQQYPEPLYVISPEVTNGFWNVSAVRVNTTSYTNRKDMPKEWGGKEKEELAKITGVDDAVFAHTKLFFAVAVHIYGIC
jgi:uncharacterized UPF0160 family protein